MLPTPPPPRPPPRAAAFSLSSASSFTPPPNLLLFFSAAAAALSFLSLLKTPAFPRLRLHRRRQPPMTPSPPPPLAFPSPESLSEWLRRRLPPSDLDSWGHAPGSKPLLNLWLELSHGESSLLLPDADCRAGPVRAVHVAAVRIRSPRGRLLVECRQLLSDGTVRPRGRRPLSEKMRPGESVEDAAARAVREELGKNEVRIVPGTEETRVEEGNSASYPGLPARYVLHSVEAEVDGLPEEGEFETDEAGEEDEARADAVFVKKHYWEWVDDGGGAPQSSA